MLASECCVMLLRAPMNPNSQQRITLEQVGVELIAASKSAGEESLPMSTRLFPYILIASRKMSLRRMSVWLHDNHGVSLSAAAISRALNQPELHLARLAETIAAPAVYVANAYGFDAFNLLFETVNENGPTNLQFLADHTNPQPQSESEIPRWNEMQDLNSVWGAIPHEVQLLLEPYLRDHLCDDNDERF